MSRWERIPFEGELNCWKRDFDLPDLLLAVCSTGKTGLLRFSSSEAEKTLYVQAGKIVFAKSTSADDRLGEYLLRCGKLSLQNYARLGKLVGRGKRLGTVLVENGALDPKGLVRGVVGQVRWIVSSLFLWTEAWYGFHEQELPSEETITLDLATARLIVDGVQRIESWRRISRGIGPLSSIYRKVPGHDELILSLDLDKQALELLARLTQPKSVQEACAGSELRDFEACRLLWAFRSLEWIDLVSEDEKAEAAPAVTSEEEAMPVVQPPAAGEPKIIVVTDPPSFQEEPPSFHTAEEEPAFSESPREEPFPSTGVEEEPSSGSDKETPTPDSGASEKPADKEPAVALDDMDMDGLGMVLGTGNTD
ncbi:MAG: DUF4388 domain-containing protein [Acidobacteriota bacterium]